MIKILSPIYFLYALPLPILAKEASVNPKICIILDKAEKDDHSFNQEAYNGFQKAIKNLAISKDSKIVEAKEDSQLNQIIRSFVNGKCSVIFSVGVNNADAVKQIVPQYPNIGMIGGMDIPLIHKFETAYIAGANKYNKALFTEDEIIKINNIKIAQNKIPTFTKEAKN